MRENIKSVGLILALIIAGVSLPMGIIGYVKEANNFYNNHYYDYYDVYNDYYNYNQTFYEYYNYTFPPEERIDYPLVRYDFSSTLNGSVLGVNKTHIYDAGQDTFLQLVMICNNTEGEVIINMYSLEWYNRGILIEGMNEKTLSGTLTYPIVQFHHNDTWLFTFEIKDKFDNGVTVNLTLWHQMYYY